MSSRLANVLESATHQGSGLVNLTRTMEMIFTNSDRVVLEADLIVTDTQEPAYLTMRLGLRSEILEDFPTYPSVRHRPFQQCDIPSLVPLIAIIASAKRLKGLHSVELAHGESATHVILTFIGEPDCGKSNLNALASAINRVMDRWSGWSAVLLGILDRDPITGPDMTGVDWREFLAGESGYVTMPGFRPMAYNERASALEAILTASRALLTSFLSGHELRHKAVTILKDWLNQLEPQPFVMTGQSEEVAEVA